MLVPRIFRRRPLRGRLASLPFAWFDAFRRPKRRPDSDRGGVPVEPDRPSILTGGAAAELEFED